MYNIFRYYISLHRDNLNKQHMVKSEKSITFVAN